MKAEAETTTTVTIEPDDLLRLLRAEGYPIPRRVEATVTGHATKNVEGDVIGCAQLTVSWSEKKPVETAPRELR